MHGTDKAIVRLCKPKDFDDKTLDFGFGGDFRSEYQYFLTPEKFYLSKKGNF